MVAKLFGSLALGKVHSLDHSGEVVVTFLLQARLAIPLKLNHVLLRTVNPKAKHRVTDQQKPNKKEQSRALRRLRNNPQKSRLFLFLDPLQCRFVSKIGR